MNMYRLPAIVPLVLAAISIAVPASAETFILPPNDIDVVGQVREVAASSQETLLDIARRYDLGQNEILYANPGVDRWLPADGSRVVLPNRYILPAGERSGLVLNLPEMRLYYFPKPRPGEKPVVITHPVSVGRMDWKTPLGMTSIVSKQRDPEWRPPASIKEEHAQEGDILPDVVPAGPNNPLGKYAMRLGISGYLIHSTNKPYGVGMRVTHGCIRMYPEDIEKIFDDIPVGTPVRIINQPIKLGWLADSLFIELHPPLEEDEEKYADYMQSASTALRISSRKTKTAPTSMRTAGSTSAARPCGKRSRKKAAFRLSLPASCSLLALHSWPATNDKAPEGALSFLPAGAVAGRDKRLLVHRLLEHAIDLGLCLFRRCLGFVGGYHGLLGQGLGLGCLGPGGTGFCTGGVNISLQGIQFAGRGTAGQPDIGSSQRNHGKFTNLSLSNHSCLLGA